jgi:phosphoribosylformylglycinamidine synthase
MRFAAAVEVRGVEGIADPEGRTIERALPALGFRGVSDVHVGKLFRFAIEADNEAAARSAVEGMCAHLLANPVVERTEITLTPVQ